jgi:hypothetical protein
MRTFWFWLFQIEMFCLAVSPIAVVFVIMRTLGRIEAKVDRLRSAFSNDAQ